MTIADELVAAHEPWITDDLETYLRAIGGMFAELELYAVDTDTLEGWTALFDPMLVPAAALPYLAQYVGERLPLGLTEALQREWIGDKPNQRRGTLLSLVRAAQRTLIGQRTVAITERSGGDPDTVAIVTYAGETPNPDAVLREILSVFPASMLLVYSTLTGESWNGVLTGTYGASWAAVKAHYTTWGDVNSDVVGVTGTYTRPLP